MNMAETHGGLVINTDAQVLDVWGEPIPHLYCSGCDTGSNIFGIPGNYPGCGCYVSFSFAFGRIAGKHMADSKPSLRALLCRAASLPAAQSVSKGKGLC